MTDDLPLDWYRMRHKQYMSEGLVVIVTGGRCYPGRSRVFAALDAVHAKSPISLVVHGACTDKRTGDMCGADRWGDEWAVDRGVPVNRQPADWSKGDRAGPERNRHMAEMGASGVIAFRGNRGTRNMLLCAKEFRIPAWPAYPAEWTAEELYELFGR